MKVDRDPRILVLTPETSEALKHRMSPDHELPLLRENSICELRGALCKTMRKFFSSIANGRANQRLDFAQEMKEYHLALRKGIRKGDGDIDAMLHTWKRFIQTRGQSLIVLSRGTAPAVVRALEVELPARLDKHYKNVSNVTAIALFRLEGSRRCVLLSETIVLAMPIVGGFAFLRSTGELVRVHKIEHNFPHIEVEYSVEGGGVTGVIAMECLTVCQLSCVAQVAEDSANARKREKLFSLMKTAHGKHLGICRKNVSEIDPTVRASMYVRDLGENCPLYNLETYKVEIEHLKKVRNDKKKKYWTY